METLPTEIQYTEPTMETTEVVLVDVVYQLRDDLVHTELFSSFLICGAIVAAVLFRRWHG